MFKRWRILFFMMASIGLSACGHSLPQQTLPEADWIIARGTKELASRFEQTSNHVLEKLLASGLPLPEGYRQGFKATQAYLASGGFRFFVTDQFSKKRQDKQTNAIGSYSYKTDMILMHEKLLAPGEEDAFQNCLIHELAHAAQDQLYRGQRITIARLETEAYLIDHLYTRYLMKLKESGESQMYKQLERLGEAWLKWAEAGTPDAEKLYLREQEAFQQILIQQGYALNKTEVSDGFSQAN